MVIGVLWFSNDVAVVLALLNVILLQVPCISTWCTFPVNQNLICDAVRLLQLAKKIHHKPEKWTIRITGVINKPRRHLLHYGVKAMSIHTLIIFACAQSFTSFMLFSRR